jgi:DUF1680 family protein
MALVELWRETGVERYRQQAEFFIGQRGQVPPVAGGDVYHQDHLPVRDQREVAGHAVRALYLHSGATDLVMETGDRALWSALEALWSNLQERRVYITGGAGARYEGEAFGDNYELPNERAYAETCAAVAHAMWSWRMLLATGQSRFADALETALYNGALAGVSLDGRSYFYVNPLASRGEHRRQQWFTTACCPPNVARTLAALPGYLYSTSEEGLWIHLYAASTVTAPLDGAGDVTLAVRTDYPWDERVSIEVQVARPAELGLFLRIPGWCDGASIRVNGQPFEAPRSQGYAEIRRHWETGDTVELALPMPVRLVRSHPHVTSNFGRVAITRGPLVYCVEHVDHPDMDVWDISLPANPSWEIVQEPELLGGVAVLRSTGWATLAGCELQALYSRHDPTPGSRSAVPLQAIPYYAWANREPGPMQTWIPIDPR